MAGGIFEFDESLARAAASEFDAAARGLSALINNAKGDLSGKPWSDDELGAKFDHGFSPVREDFLANLDETAQAVSSFEPAITETTNTVVEIVRNASQQL